MNDYVVVGLSHKSAPTSLRERLQASDAPLPRDFADEFALLSTCNRFELYLHGLSEVERVLDWMAMRGGVPREEIDAHSFAVQGRNAAKHLFFVASSLDSLVVGETQIRGQVKDAYRAAQSNGTIGPNLHRLFQSALRVSKEIADATGVGRGSVSVAGAAADLAERIFGDLTQSSVLVIGAGETADLLVTHLKGRGVDRFVVLNRTEAHAVELADRVGGEAGGLDQLEERLPKADIVAAAAGGEQPLLTAKHLRKAVKSRRGKPIVALDIAVPRAVDPAADSIDNVYRYDMDALSAVTQDALRHRRADFLQCCSFIDGATLRLDAFAQAVEAGPTIAAVERAYRDAESEFAAELESRLASLSEEEREVLRKGLHRLVGRLLHMPVQALRNATDEEREMMRRVLSPPEAGDE
ncbi:MAG: glutamyl-tRNA reductase [Planctomycetota bacterium]